MRIAAELKINEMITDWETREQERHEKGLKLIPSHAQEHSSMDVDELFHPTAVEIDDETGEPVQKIERRGLEFKDTIEVEWIPAKEGLEALFIEIPPEGEADHTKETLEDCWSEYGPIEHIKINSDRNK